MTASSVSALPVSLWRSFLGTLRSWLGDPIPVAPLAFCFDHFATLLDSGMPIDEALRRSTPPNDPELTGICAAIERPLQAGVPLHRALLPWKRRLPVIVLPVLEVGEVAGALDGAARRLAGVFGQTAALERRLRYSVFDPWLVMSAVALYLGSLNLSAPLETLVGLVLIYLKLALLYIIGRLLMRIVMSWQALRYGVDTLKLALPQMGTVLRNLAAARWGRSFATLLNGGVPISTALEVSSRTALNACYERALCRAAQRTRAGWSLADSLAETQLLPAHLVGIIRTGETVGSLGLCLEQFASQLESEAFTKAAQEFMMFMGASEIILSVIAVSHMP